MDSIYYQIKLGVGSGWPVPDLNYLRPVSTWAWNRRTWPDLKLHKTWFDLKYNNLTWPDLSGCQVTRHFRKKNPFYTSGQVKFRSGLEITWTWPESRRLCFSWPEPDPIWPVPSLTSLNIIFFVWGFFYTTYFNMIFFHGFWLNKMIGITFVDLSLKIG